MRACGRAGVRMRAVGSCMHACVRARVRARVRAFGRNWEVRNKKVVEGGWLISEIVVKWEFGLTIKGNGILRWEVFTPII